MTWLDDMFRRPVDELVVADAQVRLPEAMVREWQISDADRRALTGPGLPIIEPGGFIPDEEPEPGAQQLDDGEGYQLGVISHLNVFAMRGSGQVICVPEEAGIGSSGFVNSTVERYAESSWRFYWVHRELGGSCTDETYEVLSVFLARLAEADPLIGDDPEKSLWPSVIKGW